MALPQFLAALVVIASTLPCHAAPPDTAPILDPRDIRAGLEIPDEGYCDQPYVVLLNDGAWLCVMTTGKGVEGQAGQHIVSITSRDHGKTWSPPIDIEPAAGPEASWVMPLKTPGGRVYAFYTYNADNLREVLSSSGKPIKRVDTLGKYACKYTDDGGKTWSNQRWYLPLRITEIDRKNPYAGKVQYFWGVGKPIIDRNDVFLGAAKVGSFGKGFMEISEGIVFHSDNILTERDPDKLRWTMLPDGDIGLRAPEGTVCDEHNLVALSTGALYCIARCTQGSPVQYYSADRGRTWTAPAYATYAPDGPPIRHPRANCHLWKCANGKYLLWFHNHGGKDYADRNPAWLLGGIERDGKIHWSQPEILLYDADPKTRMSYPDLIEQGGRYWITETQKTVARVHEIDPLLLAGLWGQFEKPSKATKGLALDLAAPRPGHVAAMPALPSLAAGGGFSIEVQFTVTTAPAPAPQPERILLDSTDASGKGIRLLLTPANTARLEISDGAARASWESDAGKLQPGKPHHLVATIDGGPKIITFVIDGILCDGSGAASAAARQFGWGRFDPKLATPATKDVHISPRAADVKIEHLRLYDRYLRTSEAVGNARTAATAP